MVRCYLAAPQHRWKQALLSASQLEASGLMCPWRWWRHVQEHGAGKDALLSRGTQQPIAAECLAGVSECDVFWWQTGRDPSHGAAIECGVAMARMRDGERIRIVVTGPLSAHLLLSDDRIYRDPSHECGFAEVVRFARELAR